VRWGLLEIRASGDKELSAQQINVSRDYVAHIESSILMGFFGSERYSSEFSEKAIAGIKNSRDLHAVEHMVEIAEQAVIGLKNQCSIEHLGSLLNETWLQKKSLSSASENLKLVDELFVAAMEEGATGGKLMGAGGSGFFYLLAPKSQHERIKSRLRSIQIWNPISIDFEGAVVADSSQLFKEFNE